jgi:hypothetical protein
MRLRVSAPAPPYRGDRSTIGRGRSDKRMARGRTGILPGRAVGHENVKEGGHKVGAPLAGGEKITDPLDNCKAKARHLRQQASIGGVSPRIR